MHGEDRRKGNPSAASRFPQKKFKKQTTRSSIAFGLTQRVFISKYSPKQLYQKQGQYEQLILTSPTPMVLRLLSHRRQLSCLLNRGTRFSVSRSFSTKPQETPKPPPSASSSSGPGVGVFLALAVVSAGGFYAYTQSLQPPSPPDYQQVYDDGSFGPVLIRLAWHAAGTFDKASKTGGSNGATMRFAPESAHGANAGLSVARDLLEPVKKKYPGLSYADLWSLAGVVAIQEMVSTTAIFGLERPRMFI